MRHALLLGLLLGTACATAPRPIFFAAPAPGSLDALAQDYVRLILAVGRHDEAFVDAYYGPPSWRKAAEAGAPIPVPELRAQVADLRARLEAVQPEAGDPGSLEHQRRRFLDRQLEAADGRLAMLAGERLSFDEESRRLYDAVAPRHDLEGEFGPVLAKIEAALPGQGSLVSRFQAYRKRFEIPRERVGPVLDVAIAECRKRTEKHLDLPPGERFTLELVEDKPWGGYNWYQGSYRSLIQVNVSLPMVIDRAIDVACHEGYPGHHAYNVLMERNLVRDRGFVELTVYPLFSPQSLIAEGTANYGIEAAFPGSARGRFEREVLFPLAGLNSAHADAWTRLRELVEELDWAGNEIARRYIDGELDGDAAASLLEHWLLMSPEQAKQRLRFIDTYRSYVINYNLGQALVRAWIEKRGGTTERPERRWEMFRELLTRPFLPSDL